MLCFVLFCFFAALQFHEQKKYDLYVLSGSKFSAADLDKSYGYFNLFSGYFSYLDLFSAGNFVIFGGTRVQWRATFQMRAVTCRFA